MNTSTQMLSRLFRRTFQSTISKRTFTGTPRTRSAMDSIGDKHSPTNSEKKILVWTKVYKAIEEIPEFVSYSKMRKARDLMRIRVNIAMALATVGGCIVIIFYSKSMVGEADSLQTRAIKWEAEIQRKGREEKAAAAANQPSP